MINIINKQDCCGCNGCVQACPKQCISMQEDHEGFLYAKVDMDLCIDCSLCEKVCPVINQGVKSKPIEVYAAKNKDEITRKNSSSGGIFTLLSQNVLDSNGVVFGAKYDNKWGVTHDYIESIDDLAQFRGSKYLQSKIGESFIKARDFLKQGRIVLFSGTPCQISGLNLFLRKEHENLITLEVVCHGVPSPKVWRKSLEDMVGAQNIHLIQNISFRDKIKGWKEFSLVIEKEGASNNVLFSETLRENSFMQGFLKDLYLRPSCHACSSKSLKSGCDFSLADFWGLAEFYPHFDDDKGTSLVLVNTPKAKDVFCKLNEQMDVIKVAYEEGFRSNPAIEKDPVPHPKRDLFFKNIENKQISITIKELIKPTTKEVLHTFALRVVGKILRIVKSHN